jgi:hypothetical protein
MPVPPSLAFAAPAVLIQHCRRQEIDKARFFLQHVVLCVCVTILSNTDGYGRFTASSLRITDNIWIQVAVELDDVGDLEPQLAAYAIANQDKAKSNFFSRSYRRYSCLAAVLQTQLGLAFFASSSLA